MSSAAIFVWRFRGLRYLGIHVLSISYMGLRLGTVGAVARQRLIVCSGAKICMNFATIKMQGASMVFFIPFLYTGWERTGQMFCIVDTSLSVLMTLRMCLRELCCLFTVWI